MDYTRRDALILGAGAATAVFMPIQAFASASDDAIAAFTGGAATSDAGIELTAPEIAENGNTVPVAVSAPGAVSIILIATGNPNPDVCTFNFGQFSGSQSGSTRIRLAGTQEVVAVAKMADGSYAQTSSVVKVTIGGCGG
ncbi:thiosulfate oxidation carrier protein SoxY [Rhodobacterales bacterium 52_120_T64]|nr:thiosulfate oxidation carrier protein SoxY [Rhodobacterales bacterium 52_120_T64]